MPVKRITVTPGAHVPPGSKYIGTDYDLNAVFEVTTEDTDPPKVWLMVPCAAKDSTHSHDSSTGGFPWSLGTGEYKRVPFPLTAMDLDVGARYAVTFQQEKRFRDTAAHLRGAQ